MPVPVHTNRKQPDRWSDRGSAAVELAILFPLVVILLFAGVQGGMWYFAREAAQAAANAGARAAAVSDAPGGAGQQAAQSYLDQTAGQVGTATATETRNARQVTVTVTITVTQVIPLPGAEFTATVTVTRDRERFTTPGNR